ncbi:unnamed protein product [Chondrus crispus]|uniref:PDZ domain-containing protein n=1 Tax=Chondrus crispus TaxID=2769 RepID=R7Q6P8_CHOCR|nr:unnamed protein product [Chondrus crispus]CDF33714.1 unnamed protein product [Chondrus crispus]|eukprot:XP_005713533.1 unnamed protein product [Chondrus crispus]
MNAGSNSRDRLPSALAFQSSFVVSGFGSRIELRTYGAFVSATSAKRPRSSSFSHRYALPRMVPRACIPRNGDDVIESQNLSAQSAGEDLSKAPPTNGNTEASPAENGIGETIQSTDVVDTKNTVMNVEEGGQKPNDSPKDQKVNTEETEKSAVGIAGFFVWAWTAFKRALAPGGFVWGLVTGVAISAVVLFSLAGYGPRDSLLREKVALFDLILQDINSSYVDKVDINKLFETGVNSMLGTLDPYTQFENNAQAVEMSVKTNGRYAGVGLGISLGDAESGEKNRPIIVVSAFEGYAFDAGIRPGDVIEAVAGNPVDGNSLERVTDMLRGEPGTAVDLTVKREGSSQPLTFTLARKNVHIKDVPVSTFVGNPKDRIGYIRLQSFAKDAGAEVQEAVEKLMGSADSNMPGSGLRGLVLDLRGNPGGLLNAAIDVSEIFVPKGATIVSTKGRGLGSGPTFVSAKDPLLPPDVPLAVLVNGQTASASEIVAGAVQDLDTGVVVGSKTFGKGLVQNVQELPFKTALKYTVGKYYTPSGRCIQALNYEQSNGDGPVEITEVQENQRQEFKTRQGRSVRDGGGIEPDVEVQSRPTFLELALHRQNMYFRFANKYGAELKLPSLPGSFEVTDSIYRDFVKFVSTSEFKYESKFDEAFSELDNMYSDVGYETARSKVGDLKRATQMDMKSDFIRHEKEIRVQIDSAIRYRFQPDSERIIAELRNDDQLAEALRVLKDPIEYQDLLRAKPVAVTTLAQAGTEAKEVKQQ